MMPFFLGGGGGAGGGNGGGGVYVGAIRPVPYRFVVNFGLSAPATDPLSSNIFVVRFLMFRPIKPCLDSS